MIAAGIVAGLVLFVIVLAVETLHDCFTVDRAGDAAMDEIARVASQLRARRGPRTCPRGPHDRTTA